MLTASLVGLLTLVSWFALIIWAASRRRWLSAGLVGAIATVLLIRAATVLGGAMPRVYGPILGVSLFLGAALIIVGAIGNIVQAVVRHRDG